MPLTYFRERLYSRGFLVTFLAVTFLFLMDVSIVSLFGKSLSIVSESAIYSYGAMFTLYVVCILEALGLSIFVGAFGRLQRLAKTKKLNF